MDEKRQLQWSLGEEFIVGEYIASFRASSDRVRWVLYAVVAVAVAVGVMRWNLRDDGWARWRLRQYETWTSEKTAYDRRMPSSKLSAEDEKRLRELVPLLEQRAEFMKQMIGRQQLVSIPPLFGTSFDYNELGVVGGVVMNVMMLLLLFCLVRQHENLYLCSFKIKRMCSRDRRHSDGESMANFLYHALVMTQVLHSPPTLARWQRRRSVPGIVLRLLVFFLPAIVFGIAAYVDFGHLLERNMPLKQGYQQIVLASGLLAIGLANLIYMQSTDRMWRNIFFGINPNLRAMPHWAWRRWVGLGGRTLRPRREQPIFDTLGSEVPTEPPKIEWRDIWVTESVRLPKHLAARKSPFVMPDRLRKRMAFLLYASAARIARRDSKVRAVEVGEATPDLSFVEAGAWTVRMHVKCTHIVSASEQVRDLADGSSRLAVDPPSALS